MSKRLHKFFSFTVATLASIAGFASIAPGCGSEPAADSCYDYAAFNGTSRTVSFKADVMPIFQTSCSIGTSCHGTVSGSAGKVFLGPPVADMPTQMDLDGVHAQTVGVASGKLTTLKIVEAGNPEKSFLMHKMDGELTCADATCDAAKCGVPMPFANPKLDETKLETVRLWIAQGAKND